MLVLTNPVRLYGKKVITDLISRRGAPDQYTTPFYGMESVFLKWAGYKDVSELPATLDYICELEPDFNADNSQPLQHSLDEFDPIMQRKRLANACLCIKRLNQILITSGCIIEDLRISMKNTSRTTLVTLPTVCAIRLRIQEA